jgi:hypothetical protein
VEPATQTASQSADVPPPDVPEMMARFLSFVAKDKAAAVKMLQDCGVTKWSALDIEHKIALHNKIGA